MNTTLPAALCAVFSALGLWHFYWALGGGTAKNAAVPEIDGRLAFHPSPTATAVVGVALLLCALLIAATGRLIDISLPRKLLTWLCYALAFALLARAVGEFRLVGFFKRVRGTRFAQLDTAVYSPLCLALSVGVFAVGFGHAV